MPHSVSTFELVTLAIALAGLLLGVRSAWRDYRRDKIRLRVVPKIAYPVGPVEDRRPRLAFDIINDSVFPITVDEVGFLYRGTNVRGAMTVPIMRPGESWPHRLDPYASVTVYSTPAYLLDTAKRPVRCAYVSTANGREFRGHSEILKHLVRTGTVPPFPRGLSEAGLPGFVTVTSPPDG